MNTEVKPQSTIKALTALALMVLALRIAIGSSALEAGWFPEFQLVLFLLTISGLLIINRRHRFLPPFILVLAAIGGLSGAALSFTDMTVQGSAMMITRLHGDELFADSRILRESIAKALPDDAGMRLRDNFDEVHSYGEAASLLSEHDHVQAVVWKPEHLLMVVLKKGVAGSRKARGKEILADSSAISFDSFSERSLARFISGHTRSPSLTLATSISGFSIPAAPRDASAQFLGSVAPLFDGDWPKRIILGQDFDRIERTLRISLMVEARWKSAAHRAVPLWYLGNLYLIEGLRREDGRIPTEFSCARKAYQAALTQLPKKGDNPDLKMAIMNNLGILTFSEGTLSGRKNQRERGRKIIKAALSVSHERSALNMPSTSIDLVRSNLKAFSVNSPRKSPNAKARRHESRN